MKKTYLKIFSFLFLTIVLVAGCQKEIKDQTTTVTKSEDELQARGSHGDGKDGCRLISTGSEYGNETYTYNKRGLLDEWYISAYGGYFKQEYDHKGRLVKSRLYVDGAVLYSIRFSYRDDRIVKETWYVGDTKEIYDEVIYYFNRRGQIIKNVSPVQDYVNTYEYTREGNLSKWTLSFGGVPAYSSEYTYVHHHKNPSSATPGVGNGFPFANGAYSLNKWYSASEKDIFYDELGNPVVYIDQDPSKTIVKTNGSDYVTASDFFDNLTQEYVHFRFEYDNCGHGDRNKPGAEQKMAPIGDRKINPLGLLRKGSGKSMKDQVNEIRNRFKNSHH